MHSPISPNHPTGVFTGALSVPPRRDLVQQPPGALMLLLLGFWWALPGYWRWRRATPAPMLLDPDTWQVRALTTPPPAGTWWLRRQLTLPVSTQPLFLTALVTIPRISPLRPIHPVEENCQ